MSNIEPKSIRELRGCNFFVPSYQRGYRWSVQQVKDLILDIYDFIEQGAKGIYCIQPLVVMNKEGRWHVIDGQQRLTTIFILLSCLGEYVYGLEYETRPNSALFLKNINNDEVVSSYALSNIDFFHMAQARQTINSFLKEKLSTFRTVLLEKVKFIWYDVEGEANPIEVFTRLNLDKISLTPSELIKALLLNRNNYDDNGNVEKIHLHQQEIASEWDVIENQFQQDAFWLFFHDDGFSSATRIDYLFEILFDQKILGEVEDDFGTDSFRTFRYVYAYFKKVGYNKSAIYSLWNNVKSIYDTLVEWYNDLTMYHYVGFLLSRPTESTRKQGDPMKMKKVLFDLWKEWNKKGMTIDAFIDYLHQEVQKVIDGCKNIDADYERPGLSKKTKSRPILLLHNVLTVMNQSKIAMESYGQEIFYKFPFNLYKLEKWDVEHIDSNTENELQDFEQQKEWLLNNYIVAEPKLQERIKSFCQDKIEDDSKRKSIFEGIANKMQGNANGKERLDEEKNEKNRLWNFALLDETTNRGYGNAIFPAKRRIIIGKEQGRYYPCPKFNAQKGFQIVDAQSATSSFIMPCTKQAFMKYYSSTSVNMTEWTRGDAEAYRLCIIHLVGIEYKFDIEYGNNDK